MCRSFFFTSSVAKPGLGVPCEYVGECPGATDDDPASTLQKPSATESLQHALRYTLHITNPRGVRDCDTYATGFKSPDGCLCTRTAPRPNEDASTD